VGIDEPQGRIVLLTRDGPSSRAVYSALAREFRDVHAIVEDARPRRELATRRLRRLGVVEVAGQVLFMTLLVPALERAGARRIAEIKREYRLDESPLPAEAERVASLNSPAAVDLLQRLNPSVVVVNGTRVLKSEILHAASCSFINTHAGITPLYRGVHGGYWAIAEGRRDLAGTTVHLVDEGIDTGKVIAQATFSPSPEDSFATYPYLHTAVGIPLLLAAVRRALSGDLEPLSDPPQLESRLRTHPTFWGYLRTRWMRGVK